MGKRKLTDEQIQEICRLYPDGWTIQQLAKKYDVSNFGITYQLNKNSIKIRSHGKRILYQCNHNFFDVINSELKAYWLGFIAADGCLHKNKELGFRLAKRDVEHLVKFKASINSNHPIRLKWHDKSYSKGDYYALLNIYSSCFFDSLPKYNIVPAKTNILQWPTIDDSSLYRHFLRGYFDGDGSITVNNNIVLSFIGTKSFTHSISTLINQELDLPIRTGRYKGKNKIAHEIAYGGVTSCKAILDFMYLDSSIWLDRKYTKYLRACDLYDFKNNNKYIGNSLKQLRLNANLSLRELANLLKMDKTGIHKTEKNISQPHESTINKICTLFDVDRDFLIRENQIKEQPTTDSGKSHH